MQVDLNLQTNVKDNISAIEQCLHYTQDLIVKTVEVDERYSFTVLYFSDLSDPSDLLKTLLTTMAQTAFIRTPIENMMAALLVTEARSVIKINTIDEAVTILINGNSLFLFEGVDHAIAVETAAIKTRSIQEPESEVTIKGPHDGFIELLGTNIALVRFHCPSALLTVEYNELGTVTRNKIAILSMKGIVSEQLLEEVRSRLASIPNEAILDVNYIEEWITDDRMTPFPLLESTSRPDRVVGALLEGRVALMVNGVPTALLAPFVFLQSFQISEDYYWRYHISSLLRLLRLFCAFVTLYLPAFFVATITFHHEFLPTPFLMTIAQGREPVPYPTIVEVLLMEGVFEILREAGIRLPRQVGSAVSIVGALVLGQAAVQAGIVSPVTVLLVAFTGICSFTLPSNNGAYAIRILRFLVIIVGGFLGYVGLITIGILLLIHMASLRSFGVPYLSPVAPANLTHMSDVLIRRPLYLNKKRHTFFRTKRS
ncbi:UNVERIFIED_CONTAM: hypothetical protein ABID98_003699 [Brevibacillus sp. OAP136]